jgi:hypothetical protein
LALFTRRHRCQYQKENPDVGVPPVRFAYWWVAFSNPEHDLDGDGPYWKAQILSRYIDDAT